MSGIKWKKLLSGTDVRGKAISDQKKKANLTEDAAAGIGFSFVKWLAVELDKEAKELKIAVGHDSRLSADKLKKALAKGMEIAGAECLSADLASTPAMFMSTVLAGHQYDGAIMITASHLPSDKNGFKFFTKKGGLEKENVIEILDIAAANESEFLNKSDSKIDDLKSINLISDYAEHIKSIIRQNLNPEVNQQKPLAGFKIIVDAGNGSGGFFADKILKDLGADTEGSQFLEPDGNFPNHAPNPENKEAMHSTQKAVLNNNADLGIIFDTDVDRAAVVDSSGQEINRNKLIALASTIVLENNPGATIVTDSVTSVGLKDFIENKLKGVHHRFKRGYKNVINEAKRLEAEGTKAPLAIETSGHAAFKENYFLDDGAYLVAKILIKMANLNAESEKKIGELISDLEEAEIKEEYRMNIDLDDFKDYGQSILDDLKGFVAQKEGWQIAPKNYQGVRVNCGGNDWFLLRMSLHDPVLVLNIECDQQQSLKNILKNIRGFLNNYDKLQIDIID
ncbi:Phosphomannomutase [Halanaerobium saccharolyticum subsp. saccharolyticum DSM 6643]|uniref:Phosphomannomutase n=1 Tax=Halanaerobium saccharolyticum subsp. saccharolyticum DSM 6643 TaxID=1293054 RepID=M5ECC7_9FIRM|nr:phosphomannomutase/phosphoglucomutase [Halanaerobium saccharolyticum]CCU78538.1 Phosphomannomutase [Halanaerobium saccharolyticum subsp. saccharolyticum DSM 6643]